MNFKFIEVTATYPEGLSSAYFYSVLSANVYPFNKSSITVKIIQAI